MGQLGVYVSVPFCRAKCSFCNFASGVASPDRVAEYVRRLCVEIDSAGATAESLRLQLPRTVDTVYLGGGTPSLLDPGQLRQIFTALRRRFVVAEDAEITLEAAATLIGVCNMTALRMLRRGDIKGRQACAGAPWVIKAEDLAGFASGKRQKPPLTPEATQQAFDFQ